MLRLKKFIPGKSKSGPDEPDDARKPMSRPGLDTNPLELTPDWFNQLFEEIGIDRGGFRPHREVDRHWSDRRERPLRLRLCPQGRRRPGVARWQVPI